MKKYVSLFALTTHFILSNPAKAEEYECPNVKAFNPVAFLSQTLLRDELIDNDTTYRKYRDNIEKAIRVSSSQQLADLERKNGNSHGYIDPALFNLEKLLFSKKDRERYITNSINYTETKAKTDFQDELNPDRNQPMTSLGGDQALRELIIERLIKKMRELDGLIDNFKSLEPQPPTLKPLSSTGSWKRVDSDADNQDVDNLYLMSKTQTPWRSNSSPDSFLDVLNLPDFLLISKTNKIQRKFVWEEKGFIPKIKNFLTFQKTQTIEIDLSASMKKSREALQELYKSLRDLSIFTDEEKLNISPKLNLYTVEEDVKRWTIGPILNHLRHFSVFLDSGVESQKLLSNQKTDYCNSKQGIYNKYKLNDKLCKSCFDDGARKTEAKTDSSDVAAPSNVSTRAK